MSIQISIAICDSFFKCGFQDLFYFLFSVQHKNWKVVGKSGLKYLPSVYTFLLYKQHSLIFHLSTFLFPFPLSKKISWLEGKDANCENKLAWCFADQYWFFLFNAYFIVNWMLGYSCLDICKYFWNFYLEIIIKHNLKKCISIYVEKQT